MNKIMFDIILKIYEGESWDLEAFSKELFKPYSVVEQEYKGLELDGFISDDNLTEKAEEYIRSHEIKNAVILAAGLSSRFVPICFETSKALLTVKGEVLIERQIRQLKEVGIDDISIVVGYKKEQFTYLVDKYNVRLIETDTYKSRNNHASILAAKEYINSTIITSADLYFEKNIFKKYAFDAFYCVVYKEGKTDERGVYTDRYDRIIETKYGVSDIWVTLGYAYFDPRFSENLIRIIESEYEKEKSAGMFWADFQDEHLDDLYMYANRCDGNIIYEFDSLEDLRAFDEKYRKESGSTLIKEIAEKLSKNENELREFKPIVKEDLGRGCTFRVGEQRFIVRINENLQVTSIKRYDDKIHELASLTESFDTYYEKTLPLCAAENVISDFSKLPLNMGFQERYIVGNSYSYAENNNFVGSNYLLPFYQMISDQCKDLFGAEYTDARTLTGMNCLMMVLTSLSKNGDSILILSDEAGGHSSVRPIAERLGLRTDIVPYDYEVMDLDYGTLNERLKTEKIDYILLAPSDIIKPFDIQKLELGDTVLLYDASQILGLIAAGLVDNPLAVHKNMVMFGGTHKTLPGPACGIIMTNNKSLHDIMEISINPIYIRHTQMHQKVSLLFSLIEFNVFGDAYQERIVELSEELAKQLAGRGFDVEKADDKYTYTHQVFIHMDRDMMDRVFNSSIRFGITLNKKEKKLFRGCGIRLGTQEIARYGWGVENMSIVADILKLLSEKKRDDQKINSLLMSLPAKRIQYCFDESVKNYF